MKFVRSICTVSVTLLLVSGVSAAIQPGPQELARQLLSTAGLKGGLIVHLGCGNGELTAALKVNERIQVHGLGVDAGDVAAARRLISAEGLYGSVSVETLPGKTLPYVDNFVNLVVVDDPGSISQQEILRVLAPQGVALTRNGDSWVRTVKPRPADIDDWTHFLHDPSGNAVAHDNVVGPPQHLQWLGSPRWSRHHDRMASMSALVSAAGRLFYIMDEGSRVSIQMPPKWMLVGRDAFNGTILWKKPISTWHSHLWPLKSGPTQLARRLVATRDVIYVTLGLEAPVTAIDSQTGEVQRTFAE
ncbi:MAG: class I SAM-dependent methyltransferase, partial [Planctomycetaceae bacterium]